MFRSLLLVMAASIVGCAQTAAWKMPWEDSSRADRVKEKYGLTADQRVEEVTELAAAARREGGAREEAFTAELVRTMLAEHDPRVRVKILEVATTFETPSALSICRGALEDPDAMVRMAACDAWGERGGDEAVQLLSHRYQTDTDIDVRLQAVRMLGAVDDEAAIPALARALSYPPFRMSGLLSQAQRVFNVDGYPVITVDIDSDTVSFTRQTLLVQFGVSNDRAERP